MFNTIGHHFSTSGNPSILMRMEQRWSILLPRWSLSMSFNDRTPAIGYSLSRSKHSNALEYHCPVVNEEEEEKCSNEILSRWILLTENWSALSLSLLMREFLMCPVTKTKTKNGMKICEISALPSIGSAQQVILQYSDLLPILSSSSFQKKFVDVDFLRCTLILSLPFVVLGTRIQLTTPLDSIGSTCSINKWTNFDEKEFLYGPRGSTENLIPIDLKGTERSASSSLGNERELWREETLCC